MKYVIETTETGCVETITFNDGSAFSKRHIKTDFGSQEEDDEFCEQMKRDGICEEILDKVYDLFDGFIASDFMSLAELDG